MRLRLRSGLDCQETPARNNAQSSLISGARIVGRDGRTIFETPHVVWLIPLSQVNQNLGLAGQIRNGAGFEFFGRS